MRLIDADKLDTRERGNNSQRTMWREIERLINSAPTVDAIVPPVKVGQTVWYLNTRGSMTMDRNALYKAKINRIYIEKNNSMVLSVLIKNDFGTTEHSGIKDIGKTVFLTREAAEKTLKAREKQ